MTDRMDHVRSTDRSILFVWQPSSRGSFSSKWSAVALSDKPLSQSNPVAIAPVARKTESAISPAGTANRPAQPVPVLVWA